MEGAATVVLVAVVIALCGAAPTFSPSQEELAKAQEYLSQFFSDVGVTAPHSKRRSSLPSFEDSLKKMQEFFGLEVTGQLDANTLNVMARPRCGFTDVKKYSLFQGRPKWDKSVVTYRITKFTPDLTQEEVEASIAKAFAVYSDVVPLDFRKIDSGTADMMISFKAGDHGDFSPFDGQNGVLAHAYSPGGGIGGDAHFDEDETWTVGSAGYNLFLVAAHEFGHALGMAHSKVETALMYPTYSYVDPEGYALPDDDRQGVQSIYGVRAPDPVPEPSEQPDPDPQPDMCNRDLTVDAAASIQGDVYFFKDGHFWKKSSWGGITTKKIESVWPGIHKVDAVFEYTPDNTIFFFEGKHYWGTRENTILPGYPKSITDFGLPSYVTSIDAVVHVLSKGRTLFFVGNKYWSYNVEKHQMDFVHPRYIKVEFPGISYSVDAAFEHEGYLYFSSASMQTEYDYSQRRAVRTLSNYEWMECE